jgi:hypothetical protein
MYIKKILVVVFLVACSTFSQVNDTTYTLSTEIGIGYSRYFTSVDYTDLNKNGFSGTLKIMWNPEHLLSIGLETGYQYLYSIDISDYNTELGTTDFSASMYTIPVIIVFAMKVASNIKLIAGSGMYLLYNSGSLFDIPLESSQISVGAHAGISYTYPISNSIALGGELAYSYFSKIQDSGVTLQFLFVYDFFEY